MNKMKIKFYRLKKVNYLSEEQLYGFFRIWIENSYISISLTELLSALKIKELKLLNKRINEMINEQN